MYCTLGLWKNKNKSNPKISSQKKSWRYISCLDLPFPAPSSLMCGHVHVCVHACVYMCAYAWEGQKKLSSVVPLDRLPLCFLGQGLSLTWCSLICLFLSIAFSQIWDHMHMPLYLLLSHGFWGFNLSPHTSSTTVPSALSIIFLPRSCARIINKIMSALSHLKSKGADKNIYH